MKRGGITGRPPLDPLAGPIKGGGRQEDKLQKQWEGRKNEIGKVHQAAVGMS